MLSLLKRAGVRFTAMAPALAIGIAVGGSALAQNGGSTRFTYQGYLETVDGPVTTEVTVTFKAFDAETGGNQVGNTWTQVLTPANGSFTVEDVGLGLEAYTPNAPLYLEIAVDGGILGRQRLRSVPFALNTRGLIVDANNNVGIGADAPGFKLEVRRDASGQGEVARFSDADGGSQLRFSATSLRGEIQSWNGQADTPSVLDLNASGGGIRVGAASDNSSGLDSTLRVFDATDYGGVTLQTADNDFHDGLFFRNSGGAYTWAILREPSGSNGNVPNLVIAGGDGGSDKNNLTQRMLFLDNGRIVVNDTSAASARLRVLANSDAAAIIGDNPATSGTSDGGAFYTSSPTGNALSATNRATTGAAYGILGVTSSADPGATGVRGEAPNNGAGFGVYGQATGDAAYGVFSNGRFAATGTKSFMIDHPLDPANKYLLHYSIESNEVINTYSGSVILDNTGSAWVQLPEYFEALNVDPRYQLTAVGAPAPSLHVAQEIQENWFRIAGGPAGLKVSWEVTAERFDQFVAQRGAPVEVEKAGAERGRFLMPELFGLPASMGIHHTETSTVTPANR